MNARVTRAEKAWAASRWRGVGGLPGMDRMGAPASLGARTCVFFV